MRYTICEVLLSIAFVGCFSSDVTRPGFLEDDATHDIVISTQGGLIIRLYSEDYKIVRDGDRKLLQGKGELFLNEERTEIKAIAVEIPLSEIISVEIMNKTAVHNALYNIGLPILGSALIFVIVIMIAWGPGGTGG